MAENNKKDNSANLTADDQILAGNEEPENNREIDSKYRMILIAAQRSKQLQRGATTRVTLDSSKHKTTRIALEEVKHKKIDFKITEEL